MGKGRRREGEGGREVIALKSSHIEVMCLLKQKAFSSARSGQDWKQKRNRKEKEVTSKMQMRLFRDVCVCVCLCSM